MTGRLPVNLPPLLGELLSSWISRHADFYGVTPLTMLRHGLPEAASLGAIDLSLTKAQASRIAGMFGVSPKDVRDMSFADAPKAAHRFTGSPPGVRCSVARVAIIPTLTHCQSFEANCKDGGSLARFAVNTTRTKHPAIAPRCLHLIARQHVAVRSCCTTTQNAAWKHGCHLLRLRDSCSCGAFPGHSRAMAISGATGFLAPSFPISMTY